MNEETPIQVFAMPGLSDRRRVDGVRLVVGESVVDLPRRRANRLIVTMLNALYSLDPED